MEPPKPTGPPGGQRPPEPPEPPERPWHGRPAAQPNPLGGPGRAPFTTPVIDLRVSSRLLWIGEAVYPLQNIARVFTVTLKPRRQEAIATFLKRVALAGAALLLLSLVSALAPEGSKGPIGLVWLVVLAIGVYSFVEMMIVLLAQPQFVLAIETCGVSTALVTSRDKGQLRQLVADIADAIENPEAEFHVRVESLTVSAGNYYFGDNVHMYGGAGNVGVSK